MSQRLLRPRDHELALKVILPNEIVRDFAEYPELALSAKDDIACRLAVRADAAFLRGTPVANEPLGILNSAGVANQLVPPAGAPAPDLLAPARNMVASRLLAGALFKAAGWILHPGTLAELTTLTTTDFQTRNVGGGEALDRTRLLTYDGADGGEFLGYPFLVSTAVGGPNDMVFSADWGEAWIGVDRDVVAVDISTEANFETDETVVRCVMHHDFVVRTPGAFIYAI